jgi:hypothetical protein
VAAAFRLDGLYQGTNAVLLRDRIFPQGLHIQNGLVLVTFADRRPGEPMSAPPTIAKLKYMVVEKNEWKEISPLITGEQIREDWVVIGQDHLQKIQKPPKRHKNPLEALESTPSRTLFL